MTSTDIGNACEFAIYTYKIYQDLLKSAADKADLQTFSTVLQNFADQYHGFLSQTLAYRLPAFRHLIENTEDPVERAKLFSTLLDLEAKTAAIDGLGLARDQIIFALGSYLLEHYVNDREGGAWKALFEAIEPSLPDSLERLAVIFDNVSERDAGDKFGWRWWDFVDDGQAHWVDTFSRPNRMFCARALRLLAGMDQQVAAAVHLPTMDSFSWSADPNNGQGLVAALSEIQGHPEQWDGILSENAIQRIDALKDILVHAKTDAESGRNDRLIAAPLSDVKIDEFKRSVVEGYRETGRLKSLLKALNAFSDRTNQPVPADVRSWGYNQIDDKGAFIDDWYVAYSGWGENYGRGLANTEDQVAYTQITTGAADRGSVGKREVIRAVRQELARHRFAAPVILQSFTHILEYENLAEAELFIPRYRPECPKTALSEVNGFVGVFKFDGREVPIIDVPAHDVALRNMVVAIDGNKFVGWAQLCPADNLAEQDHVYDEVYIRVTNLSADDARRNQILAETPAWLADKPDQDRYLRMRVVVNVYERFAIEVIDPTAAFKFSVGAEGEEG